MQSLNPLKTRLQAAALTYHGRGHVLAGRRWAASIREAKNPDTPNDLVLERTALNPQHDEICKSGTDDEVGRHRSPYDPSCTTPESGHLALEEEYRLEGDTTHDPLFMSPANVAFSQIIDPMIGDVGHNATALGSARGWTNKHKVVLLRTSPYVFRRYEKVVWRSRGPFSRKLKAGTRPQEKPA